MNILIRSAHIVDPSSSLHGKTSDILVENGIITATGTVDQYPGDAVIVEAEDLHISPGWFDMQARFGEPGFEQKETLESGTQAALAGGITGVALMPSTLPCIDNKGQVTYLTERAKELPIHIYPVGALTTGREGKEMAELLDMHNAGAVAFSDDRRAIRHPKLLELILRYAAGFGGTVIHSADTPDLTQLGIMHEGEVSVGLGLKGMPAMAEEMAIVRDIYLAEYTGGKLHFPVISSGKVLPKIGEAKNRGLQVTAGTAPHYLLFDHSALESFSYLHKVKPPYRHPEDREALISALASGTIDVICSDHSPEDIESKIHELEIAAFGISSIETLFPALWTAVNGRVSLEQVIRAISIRPREILNIPVPKIEKGQKAELTLFQPGISWTFDKNRSQSSGINSPYHGFTFTGKPRGVIVKGGLHYSGL